MTTLMDFPSGNKVMATMPFGFRNHGMWVGQWEIKIILDKTTMVSLDLIMQLYGQHRSSVTTNIGMIQNGNLWKRIASYLRIVSVSYMF